MTFTTNGALETLQEIFEAGTGTFPVANPYVSLHSADPGETGANEVVGGSYVRQQADFTTTANPATNAATISFTGMPAGDVVGWGINDASTAGNFYVTGWFQGATPLNKVGTVDAADVTANTVTSPAHGFANDNRIVLEQIEGETTPTGLTAGTIYWLVGTATDTFQLSLTQGGAAIDITAKGVGIFRRVVVTTLGAGNTFQIAAGDLDVYAD